MSDTATASTATSIRSHRIPVGEGYDLHVNESGRRGNPVLLLLHGSGPGVTALSNWEHLMGPLADTFHCVAPDILGFGQSSHPNPAPQGFMPNAELRIAKLLVMLEHLDIDRVTLVGNSMGGMYSLRMAQLRPDLVERMVLMGSGGMPDLVPPPGLKKLVTFYDEPTAERMAELLLLFVHDKQAFGPRVAELAERRVHLATQPDVQRSHEATFAPGPMLTFEPQELAELDMPTLVIHGRNDAIVPIEGSYYLAEHLPDAHLYVMNNCGHWTQIEQAGRFQTVLRDFAGGQL